MRVFQLLHTYIHQYLYIHMHTHINVILTVYVDKQLKLHFIITKSKIIIKITLNYTPHGVTLCLTGLSTLIFRQVRRNVGFGIYTFVHRAR